MSTMNNSIEDIYITLNTYLELERNPVGIKFIYNKEDMNKSIFKKYSTKIPYCTIVRNCTEHNSYLLDVDNFSCMAAATFLGLAQPTEEFLSGERYVRLKVYKDLKTSKKIVDTMSMMETKTKGVEIATLNMFDDNPDVIIVICNPYNAMRLVQAYSYANGYTTNNRVLGMCALCHESTSYPFISNEINISLMCSGTRCVAQWKDNEMAVGIPFSKIGDVIEGLKITMNLMEPNDKKNIIESKLKENTKETVIYNQNYYKNSYLKNK